MKETVLITGISGFIAKHIALQVTQAGFKVRGTVRDLSKTDPLKALFSQHEVAPEAIEYVETDLNEDAGWDEALQGIDYVLHVASPFPLEQPKGRMDLVPAAKGGTLRVLEAAGRSGSVKRIVITSSMVAMMYRANRPGTFSVGEEDWTDTDWKLATPYIISKTLAEKAAWDWAEEHGWMDKMVTVNPGFVLGPALDTKSATSMDVVKLMFDGSYPALPPVYFAAVDVRDLAELHAKALIKDVAGRRLLGAADSISMAQMAKILKEAFPEKGMKIPTMELPGFIVKLASYFDASLKTVLPDMKAIPQASNQYVTDLTGITFRPAREAVIAAGESMIDLGEV